MNDSEPTSRVRPAFKTCGSCKYDWADWREFVSDPFLKPVGLQAITSVPDSNLLVFEHRCGSSVSIPSKMLRDLIPGAEEEGELPLLFGKPECEGHCKSIADLTFCQEPCINARDRRLLLLLLEMKTYQE